MPRPYFNKTLILELIDNWDDSFHETERYAVYLSKDPSDHEALLVYDKQNQVLWEHILDVQSYSRSEMGELLDHLYQRHLNESRILYSQDLARKAL